MKKKHSYLLILFFIAGISTLHAQQAPIINARIKGKVSDIQSNEILIGASISIKGTTNGSVTDENGEFVLITGQKLPLTLMVSYIGYKNKEVIISDSNVEIKLEESQNELQEITVSSRRRKESPQEIPLPISVISGANVENTGAFNPNRIKEYIPSVQFYASNGRNTTLNIRGLGSSFGLTNDGIDPGVGFYVDGVYYARPAATAIDFVDLEQIEVLRGPQGTLYGKNTTAGAFNSTTRSPSFTLSARFETTYGNLNFIQVYNLIIFYR
jgi:iron complex outermembrane receptor protein